jgi:hypothetical protein
MVEHPLNWAFGDESNWLVFLFAALPPRKMAPLVGLSQVQFVAGKLCHLFMLKNDVVR